MYVNQFVSSVMETDGMHMEQKTNYPVSGTVEICAENTDSVRIRIPDGAVSLKSTVHTVCAMAMQR